MMSRKLLLLASVGLVSFSTGVSATGCTSAVCDRLGYGHKADGNGACVFQNNPNKGDVCITVNDACLSNDANSKDCQAGITFVDRGLQGSAALPVLSTDSFMHNDGPAWVRSLPGSAIHNIPPYYIERFSMRTPVDHFINGLQGVSYYCPGFPGAESCDVAVFLYECHPCKSKKGGLPGQLIADGFFRSRCAPTFTTGIAPHNHHRMSVFVKTIAPGATEDVIMPADVEFVFFALSNGMSAECDSQPGDDACIHTSRRGHCTTVGPNPCQVETCIVQGPSPGCDVNACVGLEVQPTP